MDVPFLFITANVGSIFEDRENKEEVWITQMLQTIGNYDPHFVAIHFQECGGKHSGETALENVKDFGRTVFSRAEVKSRFDRMCAWFDQDFERQDQYTALGCMFLVHKKIQNVYLWDFHENVFKKLTQEQLKVGALSDVTVIQKVKFPQEFFPQFKWSRKGYLRTRWKINNSVLDLVNIHLFHDACNIEAIQKTPSIYVTNRRRALEYVLRRLKEDSLPSVPHVVFGDFNFRLDTKSVVEALCAGMSKQHVRRDGELNPSKIIFRDKKQDNKIVLSLENRTFSIHDQSYFRRENGRRFHRFNKELENFKDWVYEYEINFPPSYPFSENVGDDMVYNGSRCPSWCDRVFLSHSVKPIVKEGKNWPVVYNLIGKGVCMGDHKPVYLYLTVDTSIDAAVSTRNGSPQEYVEYLTSV